jgi:hypothetical protein
MYGYFEFLYFWTNKGYIYIAITFYDISRIKKKNKYYKNRHGTVGINQEKLMCDCFLMVIILKYSAANGMLHLICKKRTR